MSWADDMAEVVWEKGDVRLVVKPDEYQDEHDNPRSEDDCLVGVMACMHRRYDLGDDNDTVREVNYTLEQHLPVRSKEVVERWLRIFYGATEVLWLGLIDHSGISMYVGGGAHPHDPGGWDSGTVGLIFDTPETREKTGVTADHVYDALVGEVEVYSAYLRGEVYLAALQRKVVTTVSGFGIDRSDVDWEDDEFVGLGACVSEKDAMDAAKDCFPEDSDYH